MPDASRCTGYTLLTLALASVGLAQAQETDWRPFLSTTPLHQGDAGLDGGGDFSVQGVVLRAGVQGDLGRGNRAGVTFNYDYMHYAYSKPSSFGSLAPWKVVQRYGLSVPLSFGLSEGWSVGLSPSLDWFRENGADTGEALTWGGIVAATKRYDNGNRLGLGIGVFDRIEETSVFPLLLVDWRISDRWRLVNPLPAGPTGPAGLELEYRLDGGWNVGLGATRRSVRYRLSKDGPVPNGIGEERGTPVFIRATRAFAGQTSLNLYAGAVTAGELRVEDTLGKTLTRVDFDTAPFIAATLSARF